MQTSDPVEIKRIIGEYRVEARAIIDQVTELGWYLRSFSREDIWNMSFEERQSATALIDANIKRVNDTRLPIL